MQTEDDIASHSSHAGMSRGTTQMLLYSSIIPAPHVAIVCIYPSLQCRHDCAGCAVLSERARSQNRNTDEGNTRQSNCEVY